MNTCNLTVNDSIYVRMQAPVVGGENRKNASFSGDGFIATGFGGQSKFNWGWGVWEEPNVRK